MPLDKELLLAWLEARTTTKSPVAGAVYAGLVSRIERGEFDQETKEN